MHGGGGAGARREAAGRLRAGRSRPARGGRTPGSKSACRAPPHPQRDHAPRRRHHRLRRPRRHRRSHRHRALFAKPDAYYESAPWRTQPGGGPILLNLIHEIHNLRIMCGEIERVQAVTSNATRGFAVEDTAAIVVGFASGALGTFLLSDAVGSARSWEQTSQENPDYTTYPDEDCYHVAGTMGSLSVPTMRLKRFRSPADRSWYLPLEESVTRPERADPLRAQMAHFAAVIRGEAQPLCTTRDGALNVLVVDAIKRSAASGAVVDIHPL
nr:Gfo/Idh/MocA family oxidoreductase [Piscicoccus intestinalis]